MSINWKKGLNRVALVLSVVWWVVGLVGFFILYTGEWTNAENLVFLFIIGFPALVPWIVEFVKWIYSIGFKFVNWLIEGFKEDKPPIIEEKDSTEDKEK